MYGKKCVDVGERSFRMRIQGLGFRVSVSVIWAYSGFGNRAFLSGFGILFSYLEIGVVGRLWYPTRRGAPS